MSVRRPSARCLKCGWIPALKMTNRTFTSVAVTSTVQIGSPAAMSGNDASCADPANTRIDITSACAVVSPERDIATPVTSPHAAIPITVGPIARAPSANPAWTSC